MARQSVGGGVRVVTAPLQDIPAALNEAGIDAAATALRLADTAVQEANDELRLARERCADAAKDQAYWRGAIVAMIQAAVGARIV